jgi:endoglucanase
MQVKAKFLLPGFALWLCALSGNAAAIQFAGVNLSGAEFGMQNLPGTFGATSFSGDYSYPTQAEVDYFRGRGMNIIRLPFRWERLQHTNNLTLDATELGRMNGFVAPTTAKGVYVIIDPHNFQRYYPNPRSAYQTATNGLVGSSVPDADFANFWGQVAAIYKTNDHVIFGLMNEPDSMPTEQLVTSENLAIAAIRAAGATNLILVPGNAYTGAWNWLMNYYGTANGQALLNIVDPGSNYAFEAHQYLDFDDSGTHTNIGFTAGVPDATVGAQRLVAFTQWLKVNHFKGFLGEFAVDNSMIGTGAAQIGDEALTNMLGFIQTNADVWLGWAWWGGGPRWNANSLFHIDPSNFTTPVDKPVMTVIKNFFPLPTPTLQVDSGNTFYFATQSGFVYQLESSPDLNAWSNFGSAVTGNTGLAVTNTMPVGTGDTGFYRVRVSHVP